MTTETPKQEAFRLKIEAQEANILQRMLAVDVEARNIETMLPFINELHACQQARKHFDRWHGPDATVDDSYAARTR